MEKLVVLVIVVACREALYINLKITTVDLLLNQEGLATKYTVSICLSNIYTPRLFLNRALCQGTESNCITVTTAFQTIDLSGLADV